MTTAHPPRPIRTPGSRLRLPLLIAALFAGVASPLAHAQSTTLPTLEVSSYSIEGDNPLGEERSRNVLSTYLGPSITLAQLEEASAALEKALREAGYGFHRVIVPAQKPSGGVVKLQILQFTVGRVSVTENEHFTEQNIRRSLPHLVEGQTPDLKGIGSDLSQANANPGKQMALTFKEGETPDTVDAVVKVKDVDPKAFFTSLTLHRRTTDHDNGDSTYRFTVGFQHSNLFDRDHVLTLSYTTDPRPAEVRDTTLVSAFYQIPFYGAGLFGLDSGLSVAGYATYSDVNTGRVRQGDGFLDIAGSGEFYGFRATQTLPRIGNLQQALSAAVDFRFFRNRTDSSTGPLGLTDTESRPLSLRYTAKTEVAGTAIGGNVELAWNIDGGAANSSAVHRLNDTDLHWTAWRYGLDIVRPVSGWTLSGRFRGQYSPDVLISGEQFGLGGGVSVRGFRDREASGERGYQLTLEAAAPAITDLGIVPIGFLDMGSALTRRSDSRTPETSGHDGIMSAGVGLRWNRDKLDVAMDLAHVLEGRSRSQAGAVTQNTQDGDTRLHLSVFYRF